MEQRKGINFFFAFIAIILGWTLYKHIDFSTFKFADPYLDLLYFIAFAASIYFLIKDRNKT